MNKYFSDYLPPALVRDFRRSLRSRGYVLMLLIAVLVAVWVQYDAIAQLPESKSMGGGTTLTMIGVFLFWCIIPHRAGRAVLADCRVKSANYMMLTPLSSRHIVWSTWFSAVVQLLIVGGIGALILWWRQVATPDMPLTEASLFSLTGSLFPGVPFFSWQPVTFTQVWVIYALMLGVGALLCAVFMSLAQMSTFTRLIVICAMATVALSWGMAQITTILDSGCSPADILLAGFSGISLWCRLADAALVLWVLLELARRSYASPAENCSWGLRLWALAPMVLVAALHYAAPEESELMTEQLEFSVAMGLVICLCDALLPTYSLPGHGRRTWPLLPSYLQTPGLGQAALFLVLVLAANWGVHVWQMQESSVPYLLNKGLSAEWMDGLHSLRLLYALLCALLLTDLLCGSMNANRPTVFAVLLLGLDIVAGFVAPGATQDVYLSSVIPCSEVLLQIKTAEQLTVCSAVSAACCLLMLAGLIFRGRRS